MKVQRYKEVLLFAALVFGIFASSPPDSQAAVCGDLECDSEESASGCPVDCGVCGDLECDPSESSASCELDCL
ncbi:MAG TPA: hypothetical protein VFW62_11045, partial [bacterium]|nr:hypothetical protein [bacterium]